MTGAKQHDGAGECAGAAGGQADHGVAGVEDAAGRCKGNTGPAQTG